MDGVKLQMICGLGPVEKKMAIQHAIKQLREGVMFEWKGEQRMLKTGEPALLLEEKQEWSKKSGAISHRKEREDTDGRKLVIRPLAKSCKGLACGDRLMEQLERKRTQSEVPTVHGSSSKPDERKVDLKTCVSEPGEEILVKSLKSKSGGVVGKMEYSGKAFPIEKRKKIMMARKAEIELVLEQKLEKELMMREEGVEEGDADEDEERVELPVFIGSMSKKKKKHNKKMARRAYTK